MYAYLIGTIGLGIVFSFFYFLRKDLRKVMMYSGLLYLFFMTGVFLLSKLLSSDPAKAITPGYWEPPSLLNLNKITGGLGIEDVFYMFFVGAIAAGLYETLFNFKISKASKSKLKKGHALLLGLMVGSAVFFFTSVNAVYLFIILQLAGALAIVWQRRDLVRNSIYGGLFFMCLYGTMFLVFKFLFPDFLHDYYHLDGTTQIFILGIPLEELLYSLSLGMMWAPIYEYEHSFKDSKRRSSRPRRLSLAAGGAKR